MNSMESPSQTKAAPELPKPPWWKRAAKFIVLRLVFWYAVICLIVMCMQRQLIYHPERTERITASEAGLPEGCVHDFSFETEDGLTLHGWHLPRAGTLCHSAEEAQQALEESPWLVLFFHGNAGDRRGRVDYYRILNETGADVFAVDYRGYADNPGSPRETGLTEDARGLWKYATKTRGVDPARIVLFGESLGGGVAVRLAQEACLAGTPPGGLIVRSTFSSLADAARNRYPWLPVRSLLWDRYPSRDRIGDVTCPVLMLHGTQDGIVPCELGEKLFAAAPDCSASKIPKRFVALDGADHNGMLFSHQSEFTQAMDEFFRELSKQGTGSPVAE